MSLILMLMFSIESLLVKVLVKQISLICFRAYLEVYVAKNPTCFSRWSFRGCPKSFGLAKSKEICYDTSLSRNEDTDCAMCWKLALEGED